MTKGSAKRQPTSSNVPTESPTSNAWQRTDWNATAQQDIAYHLRQFVEPYRSTEALGKFVQSIIKNQEGEALDVACGAGANILHLSRVLKNYRWTGIDIAGEVLFPHAHPIFQQQGLKVDLVQGNFYKLTEVFQDRKFDLVLSIQTLLALPTYAGALDQLLAVSRRWLILSALFTEFNVDTKIEVMDYSWPIGNQGPYYYNVYGLDRFRAYCEARGCKEFIAQDFDIEIDLSPPESKGFGSYTQTLKNGRRLQFTGPILMPWKFIAMRMLNALLFFMTNTFAIVAAA